MSATPTSSVTATAVGPALAGIQHIGLTVSDIEVSVAWYQRVLGLERQFDEPHNGSAAGGYAIVLGTPDMSLNVGLDHHPSNAGESFDPTRTGLDHVCFQVASSGALEVWAAHLAAEGVESSGIYPMEGMPISLLTFEDPDGIQIELLAFHR